MKLKKNNKKKIVELEFLENIQVELEFHELEFFEWKFHNFFFFCYNSIVQKLSFTLKLDCLKIEYYIETRFSKNRVSKYEHISA